MMDVVVFEMFFLRMFCWRFDMLIVLGFFLMDEELCCVVELVDFWVVVEGEGGLLRIVEVLEIRVVWVIGG